VTRFGQNLIVALYFALQLLDARLELYVRLADTALFLNLAVKCVVDLSSGLRLSHEYFFVKVVLFSKRVELALSFSQLRRQAALPNEH
jgi:hypothetical protein